MALVSSW